MRKLEKIDFPKRNPETNKYHYGPITCIGGSTPYGGAISLCAGAALGAGSGLVNVLCEPAHHSFLHSRYPELITYNWHQPNDLDISLRNAQVIIMGPGMTTRGMEKELFFQVLSRIYPHQHLVLDAGGLTLLKEFPHPLPKCFLVLTPHLGEWSKLTGVSKDHYRDEISQKLQKKYNCTLVVKRNRTLVYTDSEIYENIQGSPAMSVAGMGDVLSGIIGGALTQFRDPVEGVLASVYAHTALALEIAKKDFTVLPSRLIEHLPSFLHTSEESL